MSREANLSQVVSSLFFRLAPYPSRLTLHMERETGFEPATNSLEGCDSTTELLPPSLSARSLTTSAGSPARSCHAPRSGNAVAYRLFLLPLSLSRFGQPFSIAYFPTGLPAAAASAAEAGGEGRIRTSEAARATDLQSAAFDRFATSPARSCRGACTPLGRTTLDLELAKGFEPPTG